MTTKTAMDASRKVMGAREALETLNRGDCSSVELTRGVLEAIRSRNEELGAYLWVDEDDALEQAARADAARAGGAAGRLLGLPLAIKDLINVRGQPCTCASRILEGYRAPYDAGLIAKLRAEGALFVGRTNMDEFAMGSSTENSAFRPARNPRDPSRVPGGSSGGSAAAVAGGLAIASIGTDTGGSIRQPASFCGCVGFKPTYGRVSRYGITAYASSLDQAGPLTRDVRDAALLLEVMSGRDPMDSTCVDEPVPDGLGAFTERLDGVRIGLPKEYFVEGVDRDVRERVEKAIGVCESLGARPVEISLPHTEYALPTYYIISTAEASANLARFDGVRYGFRAGAEDDVLDMYRQTRARGFGSEVKRRIILGAYVLSSGYYDAYYLRAQKVRTLIRRDFERAFGQCDVMAAPVCPSTAFPLGEMSDDPLRMYLNDIFTATANLAGICGLSVPCGLGEDGMPVGLQILGPAFGEEMTLRVGRAYELARGNDWDRGRGGGDR